MCSKLYRYIDQMVGSGSFGSDGEWDWGPSKVEVVLRTFEITKRTPKGAWINYCGRKKFVLLTAKHKKFAYETPKEALTSFLRRKARQVEILEAQLNMAIKARVIGQGIYRATEEETLYG